MASNREGNAETGAIPSARIVSNGVPVELDVGDEPIRIGSVADNDIVLGDDAVAAHHLSLALRNRCWMLRVEPGCERVYVNARPVRELALLRLGDSISVGTQKLCLLPATGNGGRERDRDTDNPDEPDGVATALRCVAGPLSGRILRIQPDILLDANMLPGVVGCLRLQARRWGARFELIGATSPEPCRNGLPSMQGDLADGDQLSWGRHRFVVEAAAAIVPDRVHWPAASATPEPEPPEIQGERHELAWLLGVAAVLAAIIALLLLLRA